MSGPLLDANPIGWLATLVVRSVVQRGVNSAITALTRPEFDTKMRERRPDFTERELDRLYQEYLESEQDS
uniref:Uncharacterized protein n=1 Tax=Atsystermes virus TaxID=2796577 RepID=A0A7T7GV03_9VIRU|nr:hypothetical protein [Atsystermes virus]